MDVQEIREIVKSVVAEVTGSDDIPGEATPLIGGQSTIDSMQLVEICLALEDKADDLGFDFDWASDATMSRSRSMFRTITTLSEEFLRQMEKAA